MPYLALIQAAADPGPSRSAAGAWRPAREALRLGPAPSPAVSCHLDDTCLARVLALQWIEARDLNEALRIATRDPLPPGCLLELFSLERRNP